MPATILLIDDHAMFREGLFLALREAEPTMTVATARNGAEALEALATLPRLDAVMTDYYLPDLGGAALLAELHRRRGGLRILVLSASEDPQDIDTALDAGAQGFVHKSADSQQLMDALRRVMAGEQNVVQASPAGGASLPVLSTPTDVLSTLTARQAEVLQLLCEGLRNAEIALRLATSEKTIKAHISAIFGALGVTSRTQAVIAARRAGMLGRPR
ncbi:MULTISPECIES: response regulator transcription factor [Variovorax]|uniref:DNA-binding NarL/FixJ family response regulator n=1 Tax=Variovorax boronicumulans TaxID=436515 RepID=A0AAW8DUX8_9BURK|nr:MULTISPECIES: response regulator transcription factor [Variovorax]MDP9878656.1 DNA-binding NarL/FixJ family response regulator [Variovorax boronicumulans]MDP9915845.1 DNA-binding NarL/FixJ family response regulator [Variovorax boronicumulans]MDP9923340.1 DNA-binding NarL/FixJ family response regulator [Variovorax boronicumulans]TSD60805.1 response regulator transcription factor [Variovorax sp. KBS0712]GER11746.1 DNA-binding response regulator [Variovorax boronicumulans]